MNKEQIKKEISYRSSRSSGSGGQHVNKVATRIELLFDVAASFALSSNEKELLLEKLANRINSNHILSVSAQQSRSQAINKKEATKRFFRLLVEALAPAPKRKGAPTLVPNKKKRHKDKKYQSEKKALRKKLSISEY